MVTRSHRSRMPGLPACESKRSSQPLWLAMAAVRIWLPHAGGEAISVESALKDSPGNKCSMWHNGRFHIVMPTQVGIHVFSLCWAQRRGWPAFAGHDEVASDASGNDSVVSPRALTAMSATVPANSSILTPFDIKKLGRINGIGHRITGDRTGQSNRRGIGWEFMHIAIGSAA